MGDQAPLRTVLRIDYPVAAAITSDLSFTVPSPVAGSVSSVKYFPVAALSGADTNSRTLSVVNKKADASGTATVASLALTSGKNLVAFVGKAITLSTTAADLAVAAGDVLNVLSTHVGNGLTDPGGTVEIVIDRTA